MWFLLCVDLVRCRHSWSSSTPHINDIVSFQEPKDAAAHGHNDDAKLVPVEETAAKPESKVSLASGCPG